MIINPIILAQIIAAEYIQAEALAKAERSFREALACLPPDQQDKILAERRAERRHRETVDAIDRLSDTVDRKSFSIF